jgi:hypothetical protein
MLALSHGRDLVRHYLTEQGRQIPGADHPIVAKTQPYTRYLISVIIGSVRVVSGGALEHRLGSGGREWRYLQVLL